ncbi:MAG: T9SS type A sorting domain-containing protein, partial [Bacteroidetes bacterium]|nr:T9SS type A sorting domain-containing protein [Bacteroidota bacterium]
VLNKKSDVSVEIYNTIGQKVETLVNSSQAAGEYKYNFSAKEKGYNAGVYFVKMIVDGNITMKRVVEME